MTIAAPSASGLWRSGSAPPAFRPDDIGALVGRFREPAYIVRGEGGHLGVGLGGEVGGANGDSAGSSWPLWGAVPPIYPEWLGDRTFLDAHGTRYAYVAGAMANGIATTRLVAAMGRAGMLGFFGAAGLPLARVEAAIDELQRTMRPDEAWGSNLIHSPNEPALEEAVCDLYLRRGVRRVSAAAYLGLTPHIVRYAATGLSVGPDGRIQRQNHVFAKISHPDVAAHFLNPAPAEMLAALVAAGRLTAQEGELARRVPVAEDLTAESDSGGHTDNRPLGALLPTIAALRDECVARHGYERPVRVGAAGGIGTPTAVASAFALGAAYVLTGSINQACVESGLDAGGRAMLAEAGIGDVGMAPGPTCSSKASRSRCCSAGRCLRHAHASSTRCTAPARRSNRSRRRTARASNGSSSAAASPTSGPRPARSGRAVTPPRWRAPSATRSTRWRSCSARIWARPAAGPSPATPNGASTTRSGAALPWAPSTAGPEAPSSRIRRAEGPQTWP